MATSHLAAALAAGVTLVTPNKRLARTLVARHDTAMAAAGHVTWNAVRVLPWQAWLEMLWLDALAAHALDPAQPVIAPHASSLLWDRIVARESALLDPRGAAERASEAWRTFHAWRRPQESVDAWAHAGIADDAASFAQWAREYASVLAERGLADAATMADRLASAAARVPAWRGARYTLAGFLEFAPQQRRLLAAMRDAGCTFDGLALPTPRAGRRVRTSAATPATELALALTQARERAQADPAARIGVVIADLDERHGEVLAAAEDLLCPELAERCAADAVRPYAVSFGTPLADAPIVACALSLIEWGSDALRLADAAVALRSPYLPDGALRWPLRAATESAWRASGARRIGFPAAIVALTACGDDALAQRWRAAAAPPTTRQSPALWASAWRSWLAALGWPGDRPLASGEWQAREAFLHVLGDFATLGPVAPALRREEAVGALRNAARRTLFQPEAPPARIQILGMLEAAGLDFDALWIAGLSAEQWPPPAHPTPLLPIAWQRERGVPRADAGRALAYARTLTEVFARAADDVVASHAAQTDGQARAGSALVSAWPAVTFADADRRRGRAAQVAAEPVLLELLPDEFAPALPAGAVVRGGVDTIESQSTCPFQAFARHRLAVRSASAAANGLSPEERGILLHRSLAAFWGDVRDSAALRTLDDAALRARIEQAVQAALGDFDARRWRSLPAPVAQAESLRLAGTLQAWLTSVERERAPFTVAFMEAPSRLAIGGIELAFRVDRVDALAAGGVAIIDYKSGHAPPPSKWFGARPAGTQVGLYALAQRVRAPGEPVRAVAYAELKAGEVKVNGLAANGDVWPGLRVPGGKKVPVADWAEVEPAWRERYGAVAASFAQGHAMVAPRDGTACRSCGMQPLCRIQRLDDTETALDGENGDDA